jgi:molecular chaperone DnaK (HSP70)
VVAAVDDGRHPVATFDANGAHREWIPGVCAELDGVRRHGWDALAIADRADAIVRSVKRTVSRVAPDDPIEALPSRPTALELLSEHVAHLVERARVGSTLEVGEHEPIEAMIAVPANATSRQRWATLEAFRRAGVGVLGVLNEPTAAGIEFAHRHLGMENKRSPKRYVVVYDLGGGTFDTSAISLRGRRFELLASEGIARLGGDDFDEAILGLALERAGIAEGALGSAVRARLLDQARAAKESMTPHSKNVLVDVGVALEGAPPVVLDAPAVLAACEPLVERTIEMLDRLFASLPAHGIDPEDPRQLGAIYVVGGGAAFAGVQRALRARLGRKVQLAASPHAATAVGLAVAADEDAAVFVQEAVTRHFGVWREAALGREKIFDPIFGKDDARADDGELVVRRRYRPRHTVGHLRFLECSALDPDGGPAGDLTPWQEILFPYDPALRDRDDLAPVVGTAPGALSEEIEETYRYTPSGEVTVRIANLTRGYERTYELGRLG